MHLVILPGMDGGADLSRRFRECMSGKITATVIDYPPSEMLGYEELEVRVRKRLAALPGPKVILGESFSGPVAIRVASDPPPGTIALVLVTTFAESPAFSALRLMVGPHLFWLSPPGWFVARYLAGEDASCGLLDQVRAAIRAVPARVLAHRLREILTVDVRAALKQMSMPILCLEGKRDRALGPRSLLDYCPAGANRRIIDGPHLLLAARPEEAAQAVAEFALSHLGRGEALPPD